MQYNYCNRKMQYNYSNRTMQYNCPCICNMLNDHCHRVSTHLQSINIIIITTVTEQCSITTVTKQCSITTVTKQCSIVIVTKKCTVITVTKQRSRSPLGKATHHIAPFRITRRHCTAHTGVLGTKWLHFSGNVEFIFIHSAIIILRTMYEKINKGCARGAQIPGDR